MVMKKIFIKLLLCLVLVTGVFTSAQANIQLSDRSYIALLSCEPGKDVYAKFGHTGIRIVDTLQMMDITYHYGIFSFDTPFFIAKFVKGATDYEIGLTTTEFFMQEYIRRNSTVHQQVLNLNLEQRQELFDALVENYKPENRKYRYNFIFDNCATRPYHIISKSLNSEIVFSNPLPTTTYRSIIDHYVGYDNWLRFGIDLVIGHDADTPIEELATISFPLFLMDYLDKGNLQLSDEMVPLVIQEDVIFEAKPEVPVITHFYDNPINITIIMLCVIALLTIWESYRRRYWRSEERRVGKEC